MVSFVESLKGIARELGNLIASVFKGIIFLWMLVGPVIRPAFQCLDIFFQCLGILFQGIGIVLYIFFQGLGIVLYIFFQCICTLLKGIEKALMYTRIFVRVHSVSPNERDSN